MLIIRILLFSLVLQLTSSTTVNEKTISGGASRNQSFSTGNQVSVQSDAEDGMTAPDAKENPSSTGVYNRAETTYDITVEKNRRLRVAELKRRVDEMKAGLGGKNIKEYSQDERHSIMLLRLKIQQHIDRFNRNYMTRPAYLDQLREELKGIRDTLPKPTYYVDGEKYEDVRKSQVRNRVRRYAIRKKAKRLGGVDIKMQLGRKWVIDDAPAEIQKRRDSNRLGMKNRREKDNMASASSGTLEDINESTVLPEQPANVLMGIWVKKRKRVQQVQAVNDSADHTARQKEVDHLLSHGWGSKSYRL